MIGVGGGVSANMRDAFLSRGYAVMNNPTGAIYSDNASRSGLYTTLYPFDQDTYEGDSGALMAWTWGIPTDIYLSRSNVICTCFTNRFAAGAR